MRTIVDLPENDVKRLDLLGKKTNLSRAELVRRAITDYLEKDAAATNTEIVHDIRGISKPGDTRFWDGLSGMEYQEKIRGEWDERDRQNWGLQENSQEPLKNTDDT